MALVLLAEQKATGANKYTYGLNVGGCAERALPLELSRAPHSPTPPPECGGMFQAENGHGRADFRQTSSSVAGWLSGPRI